MTANRLLRPSLLLLASLLLARATERRKEIWDNAQETGWDKLERRRRYASLLARTD